MFYLVGWIEKSFYLLHHIPNTPNLPQVAEKNPPRMMDAAWERSSYDKLTFEIIVCFFNGNVFCGIIRLVSFFCHDQSLFTFSNITKGNMEIANKSSSSLKLAIPSETLEESVTALNQVLELNPENIVARQELYETMQQLLRKDAFLAYQGETDVIYKIRTLSEFQFIHPKDRAMAELFPPQSSSARTNSHSLAGMVCSWVDPSWIGHTGHGSLGNDRSD